MLVERSLHDPSAVGAVWVARGLEAGEQSSEGGLRMVVPAAVPDLDGDRRTDFLRIAYDLQQARYLFDGQVTIHAHRGVDGRALWSTTLRVEESFPIVYSARSGSEGRHGLIVEHFGIADLGDAFAPRVGLTALDGDGDVVWERTFEPQSVGSSAVRVERIPLPVRFGDLAKGGATDVLVGLTTLTGPNAGLVHALVAESRAAIVDGRTGEVFEHAVTESNWMLSPRPSDLEYAGDWIPDPLPGPDVSGDGLGDYFFVYSQPRHEGRLSMRSSTDGTELWEVGGVPVGHFTAAAIDRDLDGDDTKELLLTTFLFPPVADESLPSGDLLRAVSGADGATLWTGTGRYARIPGDVDRDGNDDVVTVSTFFDDADRAAGIEYAAFGGPDGEPLYAVGHTAPYDPAASVFLLSVFGPAGDLDADRVGDFFFNQTLSQPKVETRNASAMVSGRTGKQTFDGLPWVALGASFDGRGADVFKAEASKKKPRVAFTLADGRGRGVLWSTAYATREMVSGTEEAGVFAPFQFAGSLITRDECPDVSIVLFGERGTFLVVLDGRDGSLVWSRRVGGTGGHAFGSPVSTRGRTGC